ncbi:MAG TPA: ADP-ribosylglycohydrolase family protein [Anaerolineae bacterium]|nr:ADP-ribosylglycohydrolase family protein [Anaerolineae bacterium]
MADRPAPEWAVALGRYTVEDVRQRGYDVAPLEEAQRRAEKLLRLGHAEQALAQAEAVLAAARLPLTRRPDWPYDEPDDPAQFLGQLPRLPLPRYNPVDYERDVLNSWLGLTAGAALGLPLENKSRETIAREYGTLRGYVTLPPATRNDDSTFQVISLHALEKYGPGLTSVQLAQEWLALMPLGLTAEGVALANLRQGLLPPQSALVDNPFGEWVGAAMRAEIWGLLCPGRPLAACRFAALDAVISHRGNGIYGALFVAALVSLAFVQRDLSDLVRAALAFVPPRSRLAALLKRSFTWRAQCATWEAALEAYQREYAAYAVAPYSHAHVFPCLATALIALFYGRGDLGQSLLIAASSGGDTDFAPALVGAVLGLWAGERGLPPQWRDPLGDGFDTMAVGLERLPYDEFAGRICRLGQQLQEEQR